MDEKVARFYVADANPEGGMLPGVPLRDILENEFDALPVWLQLSVDASPMYRKTPIKPPTKADKD